MRLAFESIGGRCTFASERDKWARKTYLANFAGGANKGNENDGERLIGDIVPFPASRIPDHDVLLAGFPCQPFSVAGVSKKNSLGRPHGFECATQGTLFFDVARILAAKRPRAFLLENVKHLVSHDGGNTFRIILNTLEGELGYRVFWKVLDGRFWVPQHRERIYIVGFREGADFSWDRLTIPKRAPRLASVLHPEDGSEPPNACVTPEGFVLAKYVLSDRLWTYLREYAAKHKARGNGFGYGLFGRNDVARTLSARYHKDGSEILISRGEGRNPRRLTPRECARLMGFEDTWRIVVSDTQAYRQFGNSVAVPAVRAVARLMSPFLPKRVNRAKTEERTLKIQQEL